MTTAAYGGLQPASADRLRGTYPHLAHTLPGAQSSAYRMEAFWGAISQQISGAAQLVPNHKESGKTYVGMSMVPSIWLTNFALLYTLNPKEAAKMPAFWTPIPENVADAILKSPQGRVRYSKYESEFKND